VTTRFLPVDIAALPAPAAVQALSFEAILDARMAYFQQLWAAAQVNDPTLPNYDVGAIESDPVKMLQETDAYRETLVDARINSAVLATSLAYAEGDDLTVIGATFQTPRAAGEQDTPYRARVALAFENLSIGGSYGGYAYQAMQAAPIELAGVAIYGAEVAGVAPGEVRVVCLGATASGVPATGVLARVEAALTARNLRKVNDNINVVAANIVPYSVDATIPLRDRNSAAAASALQIATTNLLAYAASRKLISAMVTPFGVGAALSMNSTNLADDVVVRSPSANAGSGPFDVPLLTGYRIVPGYPT
jgi:phage-related baseplate assembly protein